MLDEQLIWIGNALSTQYLEHEYAAMSRLSSQTKTAPEGAACDYLLYLLI